MRLLGAKAGGGSSFKQTPDNLRSEDTFEGVLGLGLGPFKGPKRGLKSIKLDGTAVENETGELNFKDFVVTFGDGDPLKHPQTVALKLGAGASPLPVNLELSNDDGSSPVWVTKTVTNTGAHYIDLRFIVNQLYRQTKSGIFDETATIEIQMKPTGSSTWVNPTLNGASPTAYVEQGYEVENPLGVVNRLYAPREYFNVAGTDFVSTTNYRITGKTTSPSVYELRIGVPNTGAYANVQWDVRARLLERETYDNGSTTDNIQERRSITWESAAAVFSGSLGGNAGWQGVAWLQMYGKASDQLSGVPEVTGEYDTKIVAVPPSSLFNPSTRQYTAGTWDGSWQYAFTNDPAWCLADLISDPLGGVSALATGSYLNKWDALEASKWFSQLVNDGDGGTHPRFSMNIALSDKQKADELVRYIAGAVGGLAWDSGNGEWRLKVDKPETAVDIFTLENIEGDFTYQHTDIDTRYNDITGKFLNAEMDYREDSVRLFETDSASPSAISKIGRKPTTIALVGCTNRQEAMRRVMMRLRTSCREIRTVNFVTNRRGKNIAPLDTILVADGRIGDSAMQTTGRIVSIAGDRMSATVRDDVRLEVGVAYTVSYALRNTAYDPSPSVQPTSAEWKKPTVVQTRNITNTSGQRGFVKTLYFDSALPADLPANAVLSLSATGLATLPRQYRVISTELQDDGERVSISAIEIDTGKWAAVDGVSKVDAVYTPMRGLAPAATTLAGTLLALKTSAAEQGLNYTLRASWVRPSDPRVAGFRVRYRVNGGAWVVGVENTQNTDFELVNPAHGTYEFEIASLGRNGQVGGLLTQSLVVNQALIDFTYADGTSIDDLRPAEAGATANIGRGAYAGGTTYNPGDLVAWTTASGGDGQGYIRIGTGPTTGVAPSDITKWAITVERGASGASGATVLLYKRSASAPTAPSTTSTFTFSTGVLTGHNNGWTQAIPSGADPLYVISAVASSSGTTDTIASGEWSTPTVLSSNGIDGLSVAQVFIYKRSATAPALPTTTSTFTFATGALTGQDNGWTTTMPANDGNSLWISQASAIGAGATDTILNTEWATPRAVGDDKIKSFYAAGSIVPTPVRDWTFTSALPSGFTMTRAGLATRVNASGYIEDVGGNLPRFDHNPVTLAAKGMLFEEPRTNLLPFSEEAASCYSVLSAAWTSNTQTSPRNTTGADTLTAAAGLNRHIGYQSFTGTAATYAYSVFLKQGTARYVQLQLADDGAAKKYGAVLDTQTGTVTTTNSTGAPSGTSNTVENYGNGWYRFTVTMTLTASSCYAIIGISNSGTPSYDSNGNPSFTAAGTETIHAWGTQLEVGAFSTSYIPNTSTGTTFRGNEYADLTGTNFSSWFTSAQGAFYIEAESYKPSYNATAMFVHQGSGSDNSGILVAMHDLSQVIWFNSSAGIVADLDHGSTAASTYYKYAGAWANNDFASSRDGTASLTDTAGTYGTTAALLRIGMYRDNQYPLNGHVKAIKFWNTRVANAGLESLSAGGSGGTAPTPSAIGDIWYNTSEGNKQYRATGLTSSDWVAVQDTAIGTAQATADGKNKIFPASASAPSGAVAGDLWPDTSSSPTVTRRFDGVSTWTIVSTVGAVAGSNVYRTDGTTVLTQAEIRTAEGTSAAITGQGALATLNTVGATQVNSNAITAPYLASVGVVTLSTSSGFYQTVTGLSFTANIPSGEDLDVDLNLFLLWSGSDGTRFNVDAILLRDGSTVASFGTVMDTNDMATNNQGGFAIPANLSCRVAGNSTSSTYSVQVQLSASVSESNSGGSKTFSAPLDIRVRQGVLRGRRYSR